MKSVIKSLRVMQRMERLATALYRAQVRAFRQEQIIERLRAATDNEQEHAETLSESIHKLGGTPAQIGIFFQMAGTILGFFTTLCSKKFLLKTDIWIEEQAIKDYGAFLQKVDFDEETVSLINRIVDDEKRHVATWQDSIELLKS